MLELILCQTVFQVLLYIIIIIIYVIYLVVIRGYGIGTYKLKKMRHREVSRFLGSEGKNNMEPEFFYCPHS